jgi:tetratricopeptide (TPR) repeat protein
MSLVQVEEAPGPRHRGVPSPPLSPPSFGSERHRLAEVIAQAERASEENDDTRALATLQQSSFSVFPELALRALMAQAWAHMSLGELEEAAALAEHARTLAEGPDFTDIDRAETLFRLACCRVNQSQVAIAACLLTVALELCEHSGLACEKLRAQVLDWRSRCYQRQRDWDAARADVDRGLRLAEASGDPRTLAQLLFQASLVAERQKQWLLSRFYAEQALAGYVKLGDRLNEHRVLNNLGGLHFLLGEADKAAACLGESFQIALELNDDIAAAYATSSLAQFQLRSGEPKQAEEHARRALELLEGRADHLGEIGDAQLVLGRALFEQGLYFEADEVLQGAEETFERFDSISHRAAAWLAQGDLAARQGDLERTAERYRCAAEALQDFHF